MTMISTVSPGNKLVFDGRAGPFYEAYYFKLSSPDASWSFWCRYTLLIPKDASKPREASLWGIFSAAGQQPVVIKQTFALDELEIVHADSFIRIQDSRLSLDQCQGCLLKSDQEIRWDFQFEDPTVSGKIYPNDALYRLKFPKTKYIGPRLSTFVSGTLKVNHKTITLSHHPAHQGHIWGTQYANSWAWAQGNQFDRDGLVFEGLTARIPLGPWVSPALSLFHFYYKGEYYPANRMRQWIGANSSYDLYGWHFEADSRDLRFIGTIRRDLEGIVGVTYHGPNGETRYCHNSSRARMDLSVYRKSAGRLELLKKFEDKPCAFETVAQLPDDRVNFMI